MAIANLHETIQFSIARRAQLQNEIAEWQAQKTLATYSQADAQSLLSAEKHSIRDYFKNLYEEDQSANGAHQYDKYLDYTKIPDFEEAIDRITAEYQEKLEELTAWETAVDAQLTTASTELEELNAYIDSYKSMLSSNIQDDFNYGLNS